jgi:hypothetical protein
VKNQADSQSRSVVPDQNQAIPDCSHVNICRLRAGCLDPLDLLLNRQADKLRHKLVFADVDSQGMLTALQ